MDIDIIGRKVIGLDPGSKRFGWSILQNNKRIASGYFNLRKQSKMRYPYMLPILEKDILEIFNEYDIDENNSVAVIESQFSGVPKELLGAIKLILVRTGIPFYEIGAKENKRIFTNNGNATKKQMINRVHKLLDYDVKDDNEADAIALAYSLPRWLYEQSLSKEERRKLIKKARRARKKVELSDKDIKNIINGIKLV